MTVRAIYSLLLLFAMPIIVARLVWRGFRQPAYLQHWSERFGIFSRARLKRAIWLHAVSVGEVRAASTLIKQLKMRYPDAPILLTCMTPTGRATANELFADSVTCVYLPYDFRVLQRRLIARFDPQILLIMETEIWPNLLAACRNENLPVLLVNARLSEKSYCGYVRYALVQKLVNGALQSMRMVGAQSDADAMRLTQLGATQIEVTGNIKFDLIIDSAMVAKGQLWRSTLAKEKHVFLAASTRDGEEAMLLDAFCRAFSAAEREKILFVIVPRHPQRFDAVDALIRAHHLTVTRRSTHETPDGACHVWLGDSMGEMAAYIAMCDIAFIGGSLLPLGGQNLIEACAQGKPVIMGPSNFNFSDAARLAIVAGAMRQVADADALFATAKLLFKDVDARVKMGRAAEIFAQTHAGATGKTMGLIAPFIEPLIAPLIAPSTVE